MVDFGPTNPRVHNRLANRLELERREIPVQLMPVEFSNRPDGVADVGNLPGDPPILDLVRLGPSEEGQEQLAIHDVGPVPGDRPGEGPAVGQPLRDDPVRLGPALLGPEHAQAEISTAEGNDRLTRRLVKTVGRSSQ